MNEWRVFAVAFMEAPMFCAFCGQPLGRYNAWRSAEGTFYCSEFCFEGDENVENAEVPAFRERDQPALRDAKSAGRGH